MLMNLVDIDEESMTVSLRTNKGSLILFDFAAAFPSVSQDFLFQALASLGMPSAAVSFIRALYYRQDCQISLAGQLFPGFTLSAGIRQGCPLSPLSLLPAQTFCLPCSVIVSQIL